MKPRTLVLLVASVLVFGRAWAAPGDPFGGDDTGFVPPDTPTLACEAKVSKATAKFVKCVGKCHISMAKQKFTPGAEEGCEAICEGKFDIGIGKISNAGPPACPPSCMSTNSIRSLWESIFDSNNGQIYCDRACAGGTNAGAQCTSNSECPGSSCGTALDGDDPGFVPSSPASLACETKLEKLLTKLATCYMKCHDSRAKESTDATGEDSCESACDTSYSGKVAPLVGCAACTTANAPTLATNLKANTNSNNGSVYCAN